MSTAKELMELLQKQDEGKCTPEELALLQQWFAAIGEKQISEGLTAEDKQRMLNKLSESPRFAPSQKSGRVRILRRWQSVAVAAALVGIILVSWLFMNDFFVSDKKVPPFISQTTGNGQLKKIQLPDSSVVWLNANSNLSYHPDFAQHREIRLTGEALFEVVPNSQYPFSVTIADSIQTTVLGTSFNIRSYEQIHEAQITVLSGKVQVAQTGKHREMGVLTQNQAIHFNRNTGSYTQTTVNAKALAGWRNGEWELKNQGVAELALLLYNQYGVTVQSRDKKLEAILIDANFTKKQTVKDIVSVFCLLAGCRYEWKNEKTVELFY